MHSKPQTVLAFAFGLRQIGVAMGNRLLDTSQPLTVLLARDGTPRWHELEALITEWRPQVVVVGDPLNMDGSDSELCIRARRFARRLHGRFGLPVELVDERLSSFEAKQKSAERGHLGNYKEDPVDSLAAELILRTWLTEGGRQV